MAHSATTKSAGMWFLQHYFETSLPCHSLHHNAGGGGGNGGGGSGGGTGGPGLGSGGCGGGGKGGSAEIREGSLCQHRDRSVLTMGKPPDLRAHHAACASRPLHTIHPRHTDQVISMPLERHTGIPEHVLKLSIRCGMTLRRRSRPRRLAPVRCHAPVALRAWPPLPRGR